MFAADLSIVRGERRRAVRGDYHALVTMTIHDGPARGAAYVGLLRNISDGGVGLLLDGASLPRGTHITVEIEGLPPLSASVCHCTVIEEGTVLGLSFTFADRPVGDTDWRAVLNSIAND